jgi:hypothetical protein
MSFFLAFIPVISIKVNFQWGIVSTAKFYILKAPILLIKFYYKMTQIKKSFKFTAIALIVAASLTACNEETNTSQ